jgi:hypothetical protein
MPEARATAALNHPHIATLYDVGPDYLVMEFVEGETLRGPLPLARALLYAGQIPGRAGCCPPQRHCASRSETGERYGVEERSRAARTVGSRAGNAYLPGYQHRVLLVPHAKRFISWSRGKAIGVAGHRGVVKAREACLKMVSV